MTENTIDYEVAFAKAIGGILFIQQRLDEFRETAMQRLLDKDLPERERRAVVGGYAISEAVSTDIDRIFVLVKEAYLTTIEEEHREEARGIIETIEKSMANEAQQEKAETSPTMQ